jgi:chondroitin 4-sulfotransferase 11
MPIDLHRDLVFIHVPKTGGSSIEKLLGLNDPLHFFHAQPIPALMPHDRTPQHFTWRELVPYLSEEFAATAFKFAFVRNPWDRFLSEFSWRQCLYRRMSPERQARCFYDAQDVATLDAFVRTLELPAPIRLDAVRGFDGHLETQLSFLVNHTGRIAMDFVGRFECFSRDVGVITQRVGLTLEQLPHLKKSTRAPRYRDVFSPSARAAVEAFYADDIREFGYKF